MKQDLNIKAVLVDDEPIALKGVASLLKSEHEIEVIASCSKSSEAIDVINKMIPDVIFLDIQMPEYNGFEVLERIKLEQMPLVVFITAYDEFALKAFNANAIDYLLKPFDDDQFYKMLEKIKKQYKAEQYFKNEQQMLQLLHGMKYTSNKPIASLNEYVERIYVKSFKGIDFLNVDEILWFNADDYYVWVHTKQKKHLIRQTMIHLEKHLNPRKFIRISRSIIINISFIKNITQLSQKQYVLISSSEQQFKISYSRLKDVKKIFS